MTERDETVYVRHMLDAIDQIEEYVSDVTREAFLSTPLVHDAVVRQLEILGEAAGRISKSTCRSAPGIPWRKITGTRHRLIHDYFEVDMVLVWNVVSRELGDLRPRLVALLDRLSDEP